MHACLIVILCAVAMAGGTVQATNGRDPQTRESAEPSHRQSTTATRRWLHADVRRIARQYRLEPALLDAVIHVESGYRWDAVSSAGAMGLMQLMPETAARFDVKDPFDELANVAAGAQYLRILLNKFGTIQLALAAYHAGEGRVRRARNTIPQITTTRRYVVRVLNRFLQSKRADF